MAARLTPAAAQQPAAAPSSAAGSATDAPALLGDTDPKSAARVFVAWGGSYCPAEILAHLDAGRVAIHYVGWGSEWDEIVGPARLAYELGRSPKRARVGEQLYVEWQGSYWPARVIGLDGSNARIHYEGYGPEWDETVGADRLRVR